MTLKQLRLTLKANHEPRDIVLQLAGKRVPGVTFRRADGTDTIDLVFTDPLMIAASQVLTVELS